ncbi:MAG: tetratricopeptide repeat protein [Acidobacteriota bacterium]|nr:tetratricopeptide repeat protein [Acidobacteriota bacterium]
MLSQVQERYEFGPFRLDPAEHTLLRGDKVIALTPKAFETLSLLVRSSGHLVRKEELLERVWRDTIVEEGNLNVIIHTLRKALGDDPRASRYIETVAKCGYRFVAEVRKAEEPEEIVSETPNTSASVNGGKQSSYQQEITASPSPSSSASSPRLPSDRRRLVALGASVLVVTLAATFFFMWRFNHPRNATPATAPVPVRSIAVLPFRVLSSEKGDEYLSLGLADALITSLSQTRQVIVRQTDAVAKYQNTGKDPLEAGREQEVDAVLEGQVQRIGDRVRVTARLVRASDGTSLWADHFEEQFTNIFAVEDAIAEKVARTTIRAMKGAGGDATTERLTKRYTENNQAYEAYLRGRYMWNKRTVDSLQKALGYFQQAVRLDPNYALAYIGLADTYTLLSFFTIDAPNDAFPKAKAAAEKALAIDGTLAEAYTALGQVKAFYEWDWNGAEAEFQKGISLNPNYPLLHHWRSLNLIAMGRMDEARAAMRRALELDPLLIIYVNLGRIDYYEGRYDQAIKQYQRALELDENFMRTHLRLGLAYVGQGRFQEALAEYHRASQIAGDTPQVSANIAYVMAVSGKRSEALAGLTELQERAKRQYVPPYDIALIYVGLGEKDKAFAWLEKAYNDHSTEMIYFKVEPLLAPLRSDSRYQDLLRRMKLS